MDCNQGSESANKRVKMEISAVPEMMNDSAANGNGVSVFVNGNESGEEHEGRNTSVLICSQGCDKTEEIKGNGTVCVNQESIGEEHEGRNTSVLLCSQDCDKTEEIKGNRTECVNQESMGGDGAIVDEKDNCEFSVGDLVWGKIKSFPWWPGMIYDPSDASDFATRYKVENKPLVAYFGDGSCAWTSPGQLIPFVEHYEKMSKQSGSRSFVCAVEEALEELGRRAELKMICSCVPEVSLTDIRPEAKNAAVRPGILVPDGGIGNLTGLWCEPADLLDYVRNVGRAGPLSNSLERVLMKSRLSAISRVKRGCGLPVYREPRVIEGLEDKSNIVVPDSNDFSVPIAVPIQGPSQGEFDGSKKVLPVKGLMVTPTRKRKLKNVAELMIDDKGINLKGKKADRDGITEKNEDPIDDAEEDSDQNTLGGFISRKRRNSKYLSPPYTTPTAELLRSYKRRKTRTKSVKTVESAKVGERLMKVAGQLMSEEKMSGNGLKLSPYTSNSQKTNEKTTDNCPMDVSASPSQVLEGVLSAAVDPMSMDITSIEPLSGFMSAYRISTYSSKSKPDEPRSRVTKLKKAARAAAANKKEMSDVSPATKLKKAARAAAANKKDVTDVSPVDFLQQTFLDLTSTLNQCDGKISAEEKSSLENEVKNMLQKVGELTVKPSS